jgi:hypothetical protein
MCILFLTWWPTSSLDIERTGFLKPPPHESTLCFWEAGYAVDLRQTDSGNLSTERINSIAEPLPPDRESAIPPSPTVALLFLVPTYPSQQPRHYHILIGDHSRRWKLHRICWFLFRDNMTYLYPRLAQKSTMYTSCIYSLPDLWVPHSGYPCKYITLADTWNLVGKDRARDEFSNLWTPEPA